MSEINTVPWWMNLSCGDKVVLKTGYRAEVMGSDAGMIDILREDGVHMFISPEDIRR